MWAISVNHESNQSISAAKRQEAPAGRSEGREGRLSAALWRGRREVYGFEGRSGPRRAAGYSEASSWLRLTGRMFVSIWQQRRTSANTAHDIVKMRNTGDAPTRSSSLTDSDSEVFEQLECGTPAAGEPEPSANNSSPTHVYAEKPSVLRLYLLR
ncbi:hypothetical protein B0H19DRAFT_1076883 [Mycena capillaripes]|nr:hypothetical protein B0H19DRAFT_1076883 [Mycena capillaripes]